MGEEEAAAVSFDPVNTIESITILKYYDEIVNKKGVTVYEIGYPDTGEVITKKRYAQFYRFYTELKDKATEIKNFCFPRKSFFHSRYTFTKERRKQGFSDFLKIILTLPCLHSSLLDFLGIDYVIESNQVMIAYGYDDQVISNGGVVKRRGSKNFAAAKVLLRVRQGYTTAIGGSFITAEAAIQGARVGAGYKPIEIPSGPTRGIEFYRDNYIRMMQRNPHDMKNLYTRIYLSFLAGMEHKMLTPENEVIARKKIRLYVVGDSIVCGVGCDNDIGPVMPYVTARSLSLVHEADVTWESFGINGGTVEQVRTLIPKIKESIRNNPLEQNEELLLVVMCGLNDWKTLITQFPNGSGPLRFRKGLRRLLVDIKFWLGTDCRLFFPGIPIACGEQDPKAM